MIRTLATQILSAAAVAMLAAPGAARACSMSGEWVRPTNFELVQLADAIVVATAVEERKEGNDSAVSFRVESALKGTPPPTIVDPGSRLGSTTRSELTDLSASHPEGHAGPCNRMTFRKGNPYLLFLTRDEDGAWRNAGGAFSRINEDYVEDSVWTRTVRRYVQLQDRLGPMEEIDTLAAMLGSRKEPDGERLSATELADIADHLSSLSPWKPTAFLLDAWRRLERGESPRFGVRPDAANRENSAAEALTQFLLNEPAPDEESLTARKRAILLALVTGDHPDALPLFDAITAAPSPDPERLGLALRFLAKHGQYPRAFQWIETRLMDLLPALTPPAAERLIADVAQVQSGDEYSDDRQRWQGDPHAEAAWPELALRLYWYQVERFGARNTYGFQEAIATIRIKDYRARPLVTLALAEAYEEGVSDWAVAELRNEALRTAWEGRLAGAKAGSSAAPPPEDDPARLPLQVLLWGWTDRHKQVLFDTFCQSAPRRHLLISLLGTHGDSLYQDLLARIANTPPIAAEERELLVKAIGDMAARESRADRGLFTTYDSLTRLRGQVKKGEKIEAEPIVCR